MPLDSSSKRRSSVGIMTTWILTPPSPLDSPGVLDEADRGHGAQVYSGIEAAISELLPDLRRYFEHYTRLRRAR